MKFTTGLRRIGHWQFSCQQFKMNSVLYRQAYSTSSVAPPNKRKVFVEGIKETVLGALEIFPGSTPLKKSLILASASAATSLMIAKEWYIVNNETAIAVVNVTVFAYLYRLLKAPIVKYLNDFDREEMELFVGSFNNFIQDIKERLEYNRLLANADVFIREYRSILQQNVQMIREIAELKERQRIIKGAFDQLEALKKKEEQQIYMERKERALELNKKLLEELKKPQMVS